MKLERLSSADEVARVAASRIAADLASGGTFALAGGTTPQLCYSNLRALPVPWGRVTVLFGDERCVPPTDPESNYRMARESLLAEVAPASVHRIAGELGPKEAAFLYSSVLEELLPLDVVLLGVGEDGHTASLFPGNAALTARGPAVPVDDAPKPPPARVSLSLSVLREAEHVYVLATGAGKRGAVRLALDGSVPAGMIPSATWFVDAEAAP